MTAPHLPPVYHLRWPDSELASAHTLDTAGPATLHLRLAAGAVRRVADGVAGYLQPVTLAFEAAVWSGDALAACVGGVARGTLEVDGAARALGLPMEVRGAVACELRLISGTVLRIRATALRVAAAPDARFHESYAC